MAASAGLLGEPPGEVSPGHLQVEPPPSPSRSPTFTLGMAKARRFIGRLSKRKRPARNQTALLQKESKNDPTKQTETNETNADHGKSLVGKENTPPAGDTAGCTHGGVALGLSPRRSFKPWPRQSARWRVMTPTERDTVKRMLRIASDADKGRGHTDDLEKIVLKMIGQVDQDVDVTAIVDSSRRLQLMQWSVIRGWLALLEHLLQRGHPADVDHDCNGPLHLACKLGDALAVKLLIQYGANVNTRSTACYPTSSLHLVNDSPYGPSTYCYVHLKSTPLQIALAHDSVQVVKLILEHPACSGQVDQTLVLHRACQCEANACVEYLTDMAPDAVNVRDPRSGETSLHVALLSSEQCSRVILQSGATIHPDILTNCSGKGDCALHTLYVSVACTSLVAMTLLLQERSVDLVNCRDRSGSTPLHLLCGRVGLLAAQRHSDVDHQSDAYLCVKFLLSRSHDVNAVNKKGESFIHSLFGNWIHNVSVSKLEVSLKETNKVLQLLLSHGVDPNASSDEVCTVINKLVNCLCSLEACTVVRVSPEFSKTVRYLCDNKADLNTPDEKSIYMITRILTACNRWLSHCVENDSFTLTILRGVRTILETFFAHGMRPPDDILRLSVKQIAIISNINFQEDSFGEELKQLLSLTLCSGLNPNTLKAVCNGRAVDTENTLKAVCNGRAVDTDKADDVQYFTARGFVVHRQHEGMLRFFSIFEETLTQSRLNRFIRTLTHILASDFKETVHKRAANSVDSLERCNRRPRALLALCRITVNNAIHWNVLDEKRQLPLPTKLQNYLCQFD